MPSRRTSIDPRMQNSSPSSKTRKSTRIQVRRWLDALIRSTASVGEMAAARRFSDSSARFQGPVALCGCRQVHLRTDSPHTTLRSNHDHALPPQHSGQPPKQPSDELDRRWSCSHLRIRSNRYGSAHARSKRHQNSRRSSCGFGSTIHWPAAASRDQYWQRHCCG